MNLLEIYDKICLLLVFEISKVKLGGEKMIRVPIGKNADGSIVYVNIIELDQRFGTMTNKKLAAIQTEIIKEARKNLEKQKSSTVF